MKKCSCCGEEKKLSEFYNDKHKKDGKVSRCKKCSSKTSSLKYRLNKEYLEINGYENLLEKKCNTCEEVKTLDEFFIDLSSKDGRNKTCRLCLREYSYGRKDKLKDYYKTYSSKNKDKIAEKHKSYYKNNKEIISNKAKLKYEEVKEAVSEKHKKYYEDNREIIREKSKIKNKSPTKYSIFYDKLTIEEEPISDENGLLLCRCSKCKEYFYPNYSSIISRILSINNKQQGECRLYCCDEHKMECSIFNTKWRPRDFANDIAIARCHQTTNRKMLLQIQVDEFGYNFCEKCGKEFNPKDLIIHHNIMVGKDISEADNMAHQILVCKEHHTHKGC